MNTSASKSSLFSDASAASLFQQELPQEEISLKIALPKGVRYPLSARSAGASKKIRRYDVTVTPQVYPGKSRYQRQVLEESAWRAGAELEEELVADDTTLRDDRSIFWQERRRRMQSASHFPCLVSPRLLPIWENSPGKQIDSEGLETRAAQTLRLPGVVNSSNSLLKPTISMSAKQSQKHEDDESQGPWLGSGLAGISQHMERTPKLHAGDGYGRAEAQARKERLVTMQRRISEAPIRPAGQASFSRRTQLAYLGGAGLFPSNKEPEVLTQEIELRRSAGEKTNQALKHRYEKRRTAFQQQQEERGPHSGFERKVRLRKQQEQQEEEQERQRQKELQNQSIKELEDKKQKFGGFDRKI